MLKRFYWVAVVGGCSFLGGFVTVALGPRLERIAVAQTPGKEVAAIPVVTDLLSIGDRFELVARKVSPAVVYVEARKPAEKSAGNVRGTVEESGSGVITRVPGRREYLVMTNHHVIADAAADRIIVQLSDGRVFRPARVWSDKESDVAILGLETAETLPTATLGDSDRVRVGNWVLAIGSPFGLNQTVTHGIVSARERGQINLGSAIRIKDFLQTDAAINPGSSGGPLLNLDGEVIGINTAIASQSGNDSGVAFSIPVNLFKRVMTQLLEKGSVSRGYLGIQLSPAFEPADALKAGLDRAQGALVEAVFPGTPGFNAGLRAGDVILAADQQSIRNENQLINYVSSLPVGQSVALQVWRDRRRITLNAVVGSWSEGKDKLR